MRFCYLEAKNQGFSSMQPGPIRLEGTPVLGLERLAAPNGLIARILQLCYFQGPGRALPGWS
jgi:hypothetical protein